MPDGSSSDAPVVKPGPRIISTFLSRLGSCLIAASRLPDSDFEAGFGARLPCLLPGFLSGLSSFLEAASLMWSLFRAERVQAPDGPAPTAQLYDYRHRAR